MKVNLKKIGAFVAGAAILASTAAFGTLYYGDTMLVDENGVPTAKVVIGEMAYDGAAASLIAGRIVAGAYKTTALSAEIAGTATCVAGEGEEGAATCTVTDEQAQVSLTVPGAALEGTYTMNTLIGDFINRRLIDRVDNAVADSDVLYSYSTAETSDNANPFTDNTGVALGDALDEEILYRIDGGMFSPLASQTLTDDDAAKSYTEDQYVWLNGETDVYDEADGVQGQFDSVAYTLKFGGSGNDYGIPVCTQPTDADHTYCKSTDGDISYATETHKVNVWFLGEKWIISEMDPPTLTAPGLDNDQDLVDGGTVKLAKESVSGIINQGESLPVDDLKFHLDDLEAHGGVTNAIISVLDANDNILKKDKVGPGQTKEFNIEGKAYRFHVYKVAPGYTFGAKWADVAIYSKELELSSGDELDEDAGGNEQWQVALGWKNKDGQIDNIGTDGDESQPDHLRTIILWSEELDDLTIGGDDEKMDEGAYIPFVQDPVAWKLTYDGLDLTSDDRETLSFDLVETGSKSFSDAMYSDDSVDYERCVLYAPYLEVASSDSGTVFTADGAYRNFEDDGGSYAGLTGTPTEAYGEEFFVSLTLDVDAGNSFGGPGTGTVRSGLWCDAEGDGIGLDTDMGSDAALGDGVFMEVSTDHYGFVPMYDGTVYDDSFGANDFMAVQVDYEDIGDGDTDIAEGGVIVFEPGPTFAWGGASEPILCSDSGGLDDELEDLAVTAGSIPGPGYLCSPSGLPDETWSSYIIGIVEKAGEGTSDDSIDGFIFGVVTASDGNDFTDGTFEYNYYGAGAADQIQSDESDEIFYFFAGPVHGIFSYGLKDDGYITERGSIFNSKDEDSAEFKMAHTLGHAMFTLATTEAAEGGESTCTYTMNVGDEEVCSGVTVSLLDVMQTATCGGEGATAVCGDADMSAVTASVVDDAGNPVSMAYMPTAGAYEGLVILDVDAVGVNTLVSVGGDRVNTVTESLLEGSPVDWTTESKIVREVVPGSKIVVAGVEMEETLDAAGDFVDGIREA